MWLLLLGTISGFCGYCLRGLDFSQRSVRLLAKAIRLTLIVGVFLGTEALLANRKARRRNSNIARTNDVRSCDVPHQHHALDKLDELAENLIRSCNMAPGLRNGNPHLLYWIRLRGRV